MLAGFQASSIQRFRDGTSGRKYGEPIAAQLLPVDIIQLEGVVITETRRRIFYEAVSYSWGQLPLEYSISCSGEGFSVNRAVFQALQRLRYEDKPRYLWIDAICINQLDPDEKSSQIRTMFSIFRKAFRVIVWLGELQEPRPGKLLVDFLQFKRAADDESNCIACQYELYTAAVALTKHPFFSRVWVRQEVFAAREIIVQLSDKTVGWTEIRELPQRVSKLASALRDRISTDTFPDVMWPGNLQQATDEELALSDTADHGRRLFNGMSPYNKVDLTRVLLCNSGFEATDPRDFVYGAIGMSNVDLEHVDGLRLVQKELRNTLPIDYKRTVSEVFQDVTKYIINRDRSLDVLLVVWESRPIDTLELPSWTPDWRTARLLDWDHIFEQLYRRPFMPERLSGRELLAGAEEKSGTAFDSRRVFEQLPMRQIPLSDVLSLHGIACGSIIVPPLNAATLKLQGATTAIEVDPWGVSEVNPWEAIESPYNNICDAAFTWFQLTQAVDAATSPEAYIPRTAKDGDAVVAINGFDLLLLFRPVGDGKHTLVGPILIDYAVLFAILLPEGHWKRSVNPISDFLWLHRNEWKRFKLV
ncbi:hypothetical protein H2200_006237 [Cladophialophora chaetospira]|uniref:Heterokaryon incompatibility domain-containing protein n=1 Tax=Cladophialophora chaetospira TaxID=386627 RepID=A0AA38XAP0_9EURO|nr:hypothetical protein H2200_006237 [Cladophialophora chaetospira]